MLAKQNKSIINFFIYNILKFLGYFITKNKNLWIFGERGGTQYVGNSKYLFQHILKNHKNIIPIWFTKDSYVHNEIKKEGGKVYYINSFKSIYYGLKAKCYIYSFGRKDIVNYTKKDSIFINLMHGTPLKLLKKYPIITDLVISTSMISKETLKKSFKNTTYIPITGLPRDAIFYNKIDKYKILKKFSLERYSDKTIITYLPTFRSFNTKYKPIFSENSKISELTNIIVFEKMHPYIGKLSSNNKSRNPSVIHIPYLNIDPQELLAITDILITDYSGCYIDFLLTEKPIIFYPYDFEEYSKYRGFFYDYDTVTPGIKAFNEMEVFDAIKKYLNNPDLDRDKRIKVKNMFHKYQDGKSAERVYQEIIKLL